MPGVDDVEARIARGDRDHLGAVRVAVEAGLADEHPRPPPGRRGDLARRGRGSPPPRRRRAPAAGRRRRSPARYSPNTARSAPAHSPVVTRASAHAIEAGIRLVPSRGVASQPRERGVHLRRVARSRGCARADASVSPASPDPSPGTRRRRRPPTSGDGSPSVHRLRRRRSARRARSAPSRAAMARTSSDFSRPDSIAAIGCRRRARSRAISASAPRDQLVDLARATTGEPANRSGYSRRSVS